jgi:hypothetical protein
MTQPALPSPTQLLTGPAQALLGIERSLPLGAPPISVAQVLSSFAASVPTIPGAGGLPFPVPGGSLPLGAPILANLAPLAPRLGANGGSNSVFARTGLG